MLYKFSDDNVCDAFETLMKTNPDVKLRLYLDGEENNADKKCGNVLQKAFGSERVALKFSTVKNHAKFMIRDLGTENEEGMFGSFNLSGNSMSSNTENAFVVCDHNTLQQMTDSFYVLWNKKVKTERAVSKLDTSA